MSSSVCMCFSVCLCFCMFGPVLVLLFMLDRLLVFSCLSLCTCVYQASYVVFLLHRGASTLYGASLSFNNSSSRSQTALLLLVLKFENKNTYLSGWLCSANSASRMKPWDKSVVPNSSGFFLLWLLAEYSWMIYESWESDGLLHIFPKLMKSPARVREAERVWEGWAARAPGLRQAAAWFTRWFPPNDALPQCTTLQHLLLGKVENLQSSKYKTLLSHSAAGG